MIFRIEKITVKILNARPQTHHVFERVHNLVSGNENIASGCQNTKVYGHALITRILIATVLGMMIIAAGCEKRTGGSSDVSETRKQAVTETHEKQAKNGEISSSPMDVLRTVQEDVRAVMEPVQQPQPDPASALQSINSGQPINPGPMADVIFSGIDERSIPSDAVIGALFDRLKNGQSSREIYKAIDTFLSTLKGGKIASDLLLPSEKLDISRSLSYTLSSEVLIDDYRIGEFHSLDENEGYLKIRLLNVDFSTDGEVYLRNTENGWMISDVQIDLAALKGN